MHYGYVLGVAALFANLYCHYLYLLLSLGFVLGFDGLRFVDVDCDLCYCRVYLCVA